MEFNTYKTNRTKEIRAKYSSILLELITRYNRLISNVLNTRLVSNKTAKILILRQSYDSDYKIIQQQMNNEINQVVIPPPIVIDTAIKKALLIGINYIGTPYELNGCINDITNISNRLVGFQSVTQITDYTTTKPTKLNIINELVKLLIDAVAGDFLVFSFSGHGSQVIDRNGDEYDGKDEGIFTLDGMLIIDDEINAIITKNLKPNVTLFMLFDCCHSGTILDLKYNYLNYMENSKNPETTGNVIMISGCRDEQTSGELYISGKVQGAMTRVLLDTIQPNITWRQLITSMCSSLSTMNLIQIPKLSSGKFIDIDSKFILA